MVRPPCPGRAALAAALTLSIAWAGVAGAQVGSVPGVLSGTWRYDGSTAGALAVVVAAFEPGLATLPELFRGFARDRVRSSMAPPHRVEVVLDGTSVRVTLASAEHTTVIDGPLDAHASVTDPEGTPTVTPRIRSGWLELRYEGEGSEMRQLLSTEADGSRMHLDVTVESPQLPTPVRYRLDYVRAP